MRYDLQDKHVFITGASGGIGRACAIEFARAGSKIVAVARSKEKLDHLVHELGDDRAFAAAGDVTVEDDRNSTLKAARNRFGAIDVLVNNAGWASFTTVEKMPREHLDKMLALNLHAPILLTQAVLPDMLERGQGQIVNIASVVGIQCIPRMTTYSATKAGLISFSTGLRMELRGTGVDVIMVAPGSTRTDFFDSAAKVDTGVSRFAATQYTPERVARATVRACRRKNPETLLTAAGMLAAVVRRVSHRAADWAMNAVAESSMPLKKANERVEPK